MLTALVTKAIIGVDAVAQEAAVKCSIIRELVGVGHNIIKENLPKYREDLKAKVLAKVNKQLQQK